MFDLSSLEIMVLLGVFIFLSILLGVSLLAAHVVAIHRMGDREF